MPRTYKTADRLKQKILCIAGEYFKEYGYDKTTYQMIADKLKISKAAIAYHFKAKPWIVYNICDEFVKSVYSFIRDNIGDEFNYYKLHCIAQLIIYRVILKSKRNMSLFFHKDHISIWEDEQISVIENYYKEIAQDFKKDFDNEGIHAVAVMNLGAKLSIFKEFMKTPGRIDINKSCKYMMYLVGALSKLDEATIERNIEYAFSFADNYAAPLTGFFKQTDIADYPFL